MFKIKNIEADYDHNFNPSTCHNGGGYWQPGGTCLIILEDETALQVVFDDTSCGDFGERWNMTFTLADERWNFHEDFVGTDDEVREANYDSNNETWEQMFQRFGVDANELIAHVKSAIDNVAMSKYYEDEEEDG